MYNIMAEDCIFVTDRNTKVEKCFHQSPIYGLGRYLRFGERVKYYLKNKGLVCAFFRDKCVNIYMPFSYRYASHSYNDFSFFEEGLSAYACEDKLEDVQNDNFVVRKLLVGLLAPFNKQVRGYLMGFVCNEIKPFKVTRLFSFSKNCYKNVYDENVEKIYIPVPKGPMEEYDVPENSYIIILDRLTEFGRPYKLENYGIIVDKEINLLKEAGVKHFYIKYHPADYNDVETKRWIEEKLASNKIEYSLFKGRLEFLALQNIGLTFIGTSSTVLFYAPLLGNTNKSLSFYKELVSIDEEYNSFIRRWGNFEQFFSKNVMCM